MLISERVDKVLSEQLGPGVTWERHTSLRERLGLDLDSLDIVQFVMLLENEFSIALPDSSFEADEGIETVGDVVDYLVERLATKRAMFG